MGHRSCFTFRTHGGVSAGEEWIYDGEEPIARFENCIIEQPEQILRYFDANLKPINLRDLKLAPGGRPLVAGVQMYWKLGHFSTTELIDVAVAGEGTDRLTMRVLSRDQGAAATSLRVLVLTYDGESGSYVYDFTAHLDLHSPELFDRAEQVLFEYSDPWYSDIPAPSIQFPGMWKKRYSHLLAEKADGGVWQMPLNHMAGIPSPQGFKRGGLFVLAHDEGNNPAFEFAGGTAERTSVGVCTWGYDIHLGARFSRDELYDVPSPRFRVRLCPDEYARRLQERAEPVPPVLHQGFAELPRYERRSSFESGLRLDEPSSGPTDPWVWLPEGEGLEWCRDEGRSDRFSLKISKGTAGPSEWCMHQESEGMFMPKWRDSTGFRISVWAKTEEVGGRGASLSVTWNVFHAPQRFPFVRSEHLTGTNDWTRLEVEIHGPPPPQITAILIVLRQDDPGTTWFDDYELEPLSETAGRHIPATP